MAQKLFTLAPVTIASGGTAQAITSSTIYAAAVIIEADSLNTGVGYVGDSSLTTTNGSGQLGVKDVYRLEATGGSITQDLVLADIFVTSTQAGDVFRISYIKVR